MQLLANDVPCWPIPVPILGQGKRVEKQVSCCRVVVSCRQVVLQTFLTTCKRFSSSYSLHAHQQCILFFAIRYQPVPTCLVLPNLDTDFWAIRFFR